MIPENKQGADKAAENNKLQMLDNEDMKKTSGGSGGWVATDTMVHGGNTFTKYDANPILIDDSAMDPSHTHD